MIGRAEKERSAFNQGLRREAYLRQFGYENHLWIQWEDSPRTEALSHAVRGAALEVGSKTWISWLANANIVPAQLHCMNISERELWKGQEAASRFPGFHPHFYLMDAHRLSFADRSFDVVFGSGILHHLDWPTCLNEINRVLKDDGILVFKEPLGSNPVSKVIRRFTPHARTADEQPLRRQEIKQLKELWDCTFYWEEFVSVPVGILGKRLARRADNLAAKLAFALDRRLAAAWPAVGPFYRHVLIVGRKRGKNGNTGLAAEF